MSTAVAEPIVERERPGSPLDTIPGVLFERAGSLGDRIYLNHFVEGEWKSVTWREIGELVTRAACGFVEAGLEPGQRVALIAANRLEWLVADWAVMSAGGITVPIYPTSTPRTVDHIIRNSGAALGIAGDEALAAKLAGMEKVVLIDGELRGWLERDFGRQTRQEVERRRGELRPDDVATYIYTSGTTGDPKGVVLRHSSFTTMAKASCAVFPITADDIVLSWMPLSHVYERMSGAFTPVFAGATVWLSRGQARLLEDLQVARPTIMLGTPRVWEKIFDHVNDTARHSSRQLRLVFDWSFGVRRRVLAGETGRLLRFEERLAERLVLRSLRTRLTGGRLRCFVSGGAPLNEKVEEFFWLLGVQLLQGYGMTETTSGCTTNTPAEHRYRTVGKAIPGTEIRIAEDGEILVRGPGVMAGYHDLAEATAKTLTPDGWLLTGDLGFLDADGYLTITDRKKDMIKTAGGKYVAPLPIEAQLENDRYVRSAVVVGDQHPYCVALIVPDWEALAADQGFAGDPESLRRDPRVIAFFDSRVSAVNRELASFETVKRFALLVRDFDEAHDELTPSSKIKRRVIAEHCRAELEEMYAQPRQA